MVFNTLLKKMLQSLFLSCFSLIAFADEPVKHPVQALVDQTMTAFMAQEHVPGAAVILYVNGQPQTYYYGFANPSKEYKVTSYTVFEMGSLSKIMTGLLFAQEIDWANVALTDPVNKYIKDLPANFADVQLVNLATHTSGLPLFLPQNITTQDKMKKYLSSWTKEGTPGHVWMYSNVGIGLLGDALEKSTGKSYDFLYRRHIIIPLKMHNVGVAVPHELMKFYAQGFNQEGKPVNPMADSLFVGAGGLKTTAMDMQRFLSAAIGLPGTPERIFYPMRMTQTGYVRLSSYTMQGLGWEIHPLDSFRAVSVLMDPSPQALGPTDVNGVITDKPVYTDNALIDKTGTTEGFRAYIAVIPSKKSGIVILANKSMTDPSIVKAGRSILLKVTGLTS